MWAFIVLALCALWAVIALPVRSRWLRNEIRLTVQLEERQIETQINFVEQLYTSTQHRTISRTTSVYTSTRNSTLSRPRSTNFDGFPTASSPNAGFTSFTGPPGGDSNSGSTPGFPTGRGPFESTLSYHWRLIGAQATKLAQQ